MNYALKIAEAILSLLGIIAIGVWLLKWTSAFTNKQKELAEVEKAIRDALRDHSGAYIDHAAFLDESYKREKDILKRTLDDLQAQLESVTTRAGGQEAAIEIAATVASHIHNTASAQSIAAIWQGLGAVIGSEI